ncbi:hypothetical protein [Synechococcus sp. ROS8604]|uniref:hypothetical protein n=1 Tax=Synechococcus sp. ROS8604 TaxID=1442557 RepID=UPI00185F9D76|nr:hypothetical protein [Synechococcus sp. ROS8604]QNI88500.1 hypothetical protein SynROS8604_01869 [Synechococcus sp. ROS8604]
MGQIAGSFRQQLLGEWLTHRFLGALEQGAELGEQIRAGLLQEFGLAFLAAQLLSHLRHRCQGGVVAGLERIPLLAYALQLSAAHRCLFTGLLRLLLRCFEFTALQLQLLAELRQALVGLQQSLLQQTRFTGASTAAALAEHPAEDEASDQPGEHTGDEQKGWGYEAIGILQSKWLTWPRFAFPE